MQRVILCPNCHVQVKKGDLGELLCPNCNARLCPKAHIVEGKICQFCGWEDPNYYLWKEAQKARSQSPTAKKPAQSPGSSSQYMCPRCHTAVRTAYGRCPNPHCDHDGKMLPVEIPQQTGSVTVEKTSSRPTPMPLRPDRGMRGAAPVSAASATARPPTPPRPFLDKIPSAPPKKGTIEPTPRPLLKDIAKAERREWEFPPLRRFVRPVLASLLTVIILGGLIMLGIYAPQLVSQIVERGTRASLPPPITSKTYTLSTNVIPETGGEIEIIPPSSSSGTFEPGSQITLTAIPGDCFTFDGGHWEIDGTLEWKETVTITMDSNRSITAYFQPKDTTSPTISEVKTSSYSDTSATITWETDKPATSQVEYGKTKDYGLSTTSDSELTTSHKVLLTALEPGNTYYFKVKSQDQCGNEATHEEKLTTPSKIPVGYEVGKRAPDFTLSSYQDDNPESPNKGQTVSLSDFQGKKVLLNFWSTRCGPCLAELPYIRTMYDAYCQENSSDTDSAIITICLGETEDIAERIEILKDKYTDEVSRFTLPILLDPQHQVKNLYNVGVVPTTFLIDSNGIVREVKIGRFEDEGEIIDMLNRIY